MPKAAEASLLSGQGSCSSGPMKTSITAAVGTMQMMVGLFNVGLGSGRTSTRLGDVGSLGAAYWLGAVFVVTGIMSVLAGRFPATCLVGFTVFLNLVGSVSAIAAIVLYCLDVKNASLIWMCGASSSVALPHNDGCRNVALLVQSLLTSMDTTLMLLAALLLVASLRFAVLGARALGRSVCDAGSPAGLLRPSVAAALGVVQVMVGLLSLGLAPRQTFDFPAASTGVGAAFWLGVVYLAAGVLAVGAGWSLSACLMAVAVSVNLAGAIVAVVGVVLFAVDLGSVSVVWMCRGYSDEKNNCLKVAHIAQRLLTATDVTMIVLTVLQFCVCISFAVLGIKALLRSKQGDRSAELLQTDNVP